MARKRQRSYVIIFLELYCSEDEGRSHLITSLKRVSHAEVNVAHAPYRRMQRTTVPEVRAEVGRCFSFVQPSVASKRRIYRGSLYHRLRSSLGSSRISRFFPATPGCVPRAPAPWRQRGLRPILSPSRVPLSSRTSTRTSFFFSGGQGGRAGSP